MVLLAVDAGELVVQVAVKLGLGITLSHCPELVIHVVK